ncbi:MAG: hypothetical protein ACREBF_03455 [Candidatus Micrarchaeales archaeon]
METFATFANSIKGNEKKLVLAALLRIDNFTGWGLLSPHNPVLSHLVPFAERSLVAINHEPIHVERAIGICYSAQRTKAGKKFSNYMNDNGYFGDIPGTLQDLSAHINRVFRQEMKAAGLS